jgi:Transposase DDE domain
MITSKSPRMVAMVALAAGMEAFSDYSHRFSPHKFTQPQLFACLVLKEFEKKDYRGVAQFLEDWLELRQAIGLRFVPHFTTLQKASRRLLKVKHVRTLLKETLRRIHKRRKNVPYAAGDSSGFDAHHASRYFIWRRDTHAENQKRPKKQVSYRRYGKLMVIVNCMSHAILAAVASQGPTPDIDQLDDVIGELPDSVKIRHMVLDAGFDSAHNHRLLREEHGMRSTIPPKHGRPTKDPNALPSDKYRRLMKRRFRDGSPKSYRKRPQVETVFSMLKRNLGDALRAKTTHGRRRDMFLRVLTHNITLAARWVFYRAVVNRFAVLKQYNT